MSDQLKSQLEGDTDYLLQHDHYLRMLKQLENRRESAIASFSNGIPGDAAMHQLAGEIRAINETMGLLGYFKAREILRYKQL